MVRKAPERLSGLDGLDNPERIKLLAIIDKFRELGVSEDLSLPQVCHMPRRMLSGNANWLL
jgi:hypothetical protein